MKLRLLGFSSEYSYGRSNLPSLKEWVRTVADDEKSKVVNYLASAPMLLGDFCITQDVIDPSAPFFGDKSLKTDGVWVWPSDFSYYVEKYNLFLAPEFLQHVRSKDFCPPDESEVNFHEIDFPPYY